MLGIASVAAVEAAPALRSSTQSRVAAPGRPVRVPSSEENRAPCYPAKSTSAGVAYGTATQRTGPTSQAAKGRHSCGRNVFGQRQSPVLAQTGTGSAPRSL